MVDVHEIKLSILWFWMLYGDVMILSCNDNVCSPYGLFSILSKLLFAFIGNELLESKYEIKNTIIIISLLK